MRALIIGDIHLADRPPSIRTETYTEDILDKLRAAVRIAADENCDAIISAGDVFHLKTPTRNSHALVQRTGEVLTAAGIPVLVVPGNHDLSNDRLDSLRKQPLGTLAKMQGIELLMGPHEAFPVFGIPYLHDWANELPKWMKKYRAWADEHKVENLDFWPLLVTHAPIFPPGEDPPYDYIPADEWAEMMEKGGCYYGHIHDPHGVYTPSPSVPVEMCNHGAISRGSLHEATLKREPAVTIWDTALRDRWKRVPLPFRPVEAVFRLQEKEDVDQRTSRVEEFLESVGHTALDGLSIEEVHAHARTRGLQPRTLTLIEELLENVG